MNRDGVYLSGSCGNSISGNIFYNNSESGVSITQVSSRDNRVFLNDFVLNGVYGRPPFYQALDDGTDNDWFKNTSYGVLTLSSSEGNYWFDYTGGDNNSDGVGDTSYSVYGRAENEDPYPLMSPCNWDKIWDYTWKRIT